MIADKKLLKEYPFDGEFYINKENSSNPFEETSITKEVVLKTKCDIQESSKKSVDGTSIVSFDVYFPFDVDSGVDIKRGMFFKGFLFGLEVNGMVEGVFPTQLGGCSCYITDVDV